MPLSQRIWSLENLYMERREFLFQKEMTKLSTEPGTFRSKLAAAILDSIDQIHINPGSRCSLPWGRLRHHHLPSLCYCRPDGLVYAVEFYSSGRDLINLAKRTNIIPVIEDAQHPHKYHMLIAIVDVIFADEAQPYQTRTVALNAHTFLWNGGHFVISIKANCIDSIASVEAVFASEVKKVQQENMKTQE